MSEQITTQKDLEALADRPDVLELASDIEQVIHDSGVGQDEVHPIEVAARLVAAGYGRRPDAPTPTPAGDDQREALADLIALHRPIIRTQGLTLGGHLLAREPERHTTTLQIVGCSCMDRVFVKDQESWDEHIADVVLADHAPGGDDQREVPTRQALTNAGVAYLLTIAELDGEITRLRAALAARPSAPTVTTEQVRDAIGAVGWDRDGDLDMVTDLLAVLSIEVHP